MADTLETLRQAWQKLSMIQRVMLLGAVFAALAGLSLVYSWASRPEMSMLYSNLEAEEAARIVEKLTEEKIPHEIGTGGTTIYVPESMKNSTRLLLAGQGLPSGGNGGYKILDEEKIGLSPDRQRVNYLRALEGELAKTVESVSGVRRARVHVVMPERRILSRSAEQASASVMVTMNGGRRLAPEQVNAVAYLVAGAVEGLREDQVVVADSQGELLTSEGPDPTIAGGQSFFDLQSRVERYHEEKIHQLLAPLGRDRVSVKVAADIENTSLTETKEIVENNGMTEEVSKNNTETPVTNGNAAAETPNLAGSVGVQKEETLVETRYEPGRNVVQTQRPAGKVKSLSVTAIVDLAGSTAAEEGAQPPMTVADVEEAIRMALGNEVVTAIKVVNMPFGNLSAPRGAAPEGQDWTSPQYLMSIGKELSLGLLALAVVSLAIVARLKSHKRLKAKMVRKVEQLTETNEETPSSDGSRRQLSGDPGSYLPLELESADTEQLRLGMDKALTDRPDEIKRVLTEWIANS